MTENSAESDSGWFAEWDDEQTDTDYRWKPCLETGNGFIPCFQVWFKTKAECEEWIAANVIGAGWIYGDPTEISVTPPRQGDA